ncbi:MAG: hypothetical protein JKY65_31810 [Planctomycetes bacterium]|nr:hypothetical protein [Planctomycetota bacterium]
MARKKKAEEHANHERWLVSYADFITLLFAFFVVLYSMSQVDLRKFDQVKKSFGASFSGAADLGGDKPAQQRVKQESWRYAPIFPNVVPREDSQGEEETPKHLKALQQRLIALFAAEGLDEGVRVAVNGRGLSVRIEVPQLFEGKQISRSGARRLDRIGTLATSLKRPLLISALSVIREPNRLAQRFALRGTQVAAVGHYLSQRYQLGVFMSADAEVGGVALGAARRSEVVEILFLKNT